jgi:peptide-methionine (S)-S-oxide reductase
MMDSLRHSGKISSTMTCSNSNTDDCFHHKKIPALQLINSNSILKHLPSTHTNYTHTTQTTTNTINLQLSAPTLITLIITTLIPLMAFQMPSFLTRLTRPFTTSLSRPLVPDALATMNFPPNTQRAIFAGGCFWGLEELYRKDWGNKGLLDCRVGYTGGATEAPSYAEVCSGTTNHAESLLIAFDPEKVSYRQLVEYFFKMHDPTTLNRQGADSGTQYRSAIFTENDEQMKIAEEIKEKVRKEWYKGKTITTEIRKATQWYDAEPKHQKYLESAGPWGYHCPAHFVRKFPELSE